VTPPGGRFDVLARESEEDYSNKGLSTTFQEAIDNAVGQVMSDNMVKIKTDEKKVKKSDKTKSATVTRGQEGQGDLVADSIMQVMTKVVPVIGTQVTEAVKASTSALVSELKQKATVTKMDTEKIKADVQVQAFELDKLEQYGRRESIRVSITVLYFP
jgi:hypothetical protein